MVIIVEGPDGAGKTMLATRIAAQTGYKLIHMTQPLTDEDKTNMLVKYQRLIKKHKNLILDRAWYSELAYGPVIRGESAMSYCDMVLLENMLARGGALLIYCTGNEYDLWRRCKARGEEYVTNYVDFTKIYDNYTSIMSMPHSIPVVRYEYKEM